MKLTLNSNQTPIFFTADLHFWHKNIIQYCNRPFTTVEGMNEELVNNWNKVVPDNGIVFILGDLTFTKDLEALSCLLDRLKGYIYLIPGNHDNLDFLAKISRRIKVLGSIQEVTFLVEDEKIPFVLCHYAMRVWNKSHHGAIHLYGHSHGSLLEDPSARSMDVGVDNHKDYAPFSIDEVLIHMYRKAFKPVDHHTGERR